MVRSRSQCSQAKCKWRLWNISLISYHSKRSKGDVLRHVGCVGWSLITNPPNSWVLISKHCPASPKKWVRDSTNCCWLQVCQKLREKIWSVGLDWRISSGEAIAWVARRTATLETSVVKATILTIRVNVVEAWDKLKLLNRSRVEFSWAVEDMGFWWGSELLYLLPRSQRPHDYPFSPSDRVSKSVSRGVEVW